MFLLQDQLKDTQLLLFQKQEKNYELEMKVMTCATIAEAPHTRKLAHTLLIWDMSVATMKACLVCIIHNQKGNKAWLCLTAR